MQKRPLSRHLVALWFADIAGYTVLAAKDEHRALQLVELLQTISRNAIREHEGRLVKFIGDAVLAEFPSTESAVRAAVLLTRRYVQRCGDDVQTNQVRVGVHVGDVAVGPDGDLYGNGVNAAARVQEVAKPGQVLVSEDVWRQLRNRAGFQFESLGDQSLKGVGALNLYGVTVEDGNEMLISLPATEAEAHFGEEESGKIHSIAVLPFADLSAEGDQEYFSDGIAEEILNALTKVGGLHVPARTSCFAFRGATVDARDIGRRLGVESLLEGSVRKAGNRVRISVQLIDAENGYQRWSEQFDRGTEDIFAIQDEIARKVVGALGLSLSEHEKRFLKPSTTSVEAYEFYLRGRKRFQRWARQNVEAARRMFARAVEIDPSFAAAWAGLANAYVDLFRWSREPHLLEEAQRASDRALKLDPRSAEAHVSAGQGLAIQRRFAEAAQEFERAIDLDPKFFDAYYLYGRCAFEGGDLEKARDGFERARRARPDDYQSNNFLGLVLHELGREDEAQEVDKHAIDLAKRHIQLNPDDPRAYSLSATVLVRLGDKELSKQWAQQAMALAPNDPLILYNAACQLALLGETDRALDGLEQAIAAGVAVGDWVQHDPDFTALRNHPRFQAIVKRIAPTAEQ